jgi:hypothetical protein
VFTCASFCYNYLCYGIFIEWVLLQAAHMQIPDNEVRESAVEMTLKNIGKDLSHDGWLRLEQACSDIDNPPLLFSVDPEALNAFVALVNAYRAAPRADQGVLLVPPPVGLVLPAGPVDPNIFFTAVLNYIRAAAASPPPIAFVCLPCNTSQFLSAALATAALNYSPWVNAIVAYAGVAGIQPIASLWARRERSQMCDRALKMPLILCN